MGTLVREWVLNKLGVAVPEWENPVEFRKESSNGYLIAEILRKYSILSDDQVIALSHNHTEKTKRRNMKHLYKWMNEAGMTLDMIDLQQISEERPGATVRFLYKLHSFLEGWHSTCGPTRFQLQRRSHSTLSTDPPSSFSTLLDFAVSSTDTSASLKGSDDTSGSGSSSESSSTTSSSTSSSSSTSIESNGSPEEEVKEVRKSAEVKEIDVQLDPQRERGARTSVYHHYEHGRLLTPSGHEVGLLGTSESRHVYDRARDPGLQQEKGFSLRPYHYHVPDNLDSTEQQRFYCARVAAAQAHSYLMKEEAVKKKWEDDDQSDSETESSSSSTLSSLRTFDFSILGIEQAQKLRDIQAKHKKEQTLVDEMSSFDAKLDAITSDAEELEKFRMKIRLDPELQDKERPPEVKEDPREALPIPLNRAAMRDRLTQLKCHRKEDALADKERSKWRRAMSEQLFKKIPEQIYEDLVEFTMAKTTKIYGKEVEFMEYLTSIYESKNVFLSHLRLEETAIQGLRIARNEKETLALGRAEKLAAAQRELGLRRDLRIEEERKAFEMALLLKLIEFELNKMLKLALMIAEYRLRNNGEEPPLSMILEWKKRFAMGLPTPEEEPWPSDYPSTDAMTPFDFADGLCHIVLSDHPIPIELNPLLLPIDDSTPSEVTTADEGVLADGEEEAEDEDASSKKKKKKKEKVEISSKKKGEAKGKKGEIIDGKSSAGLSKKSKKSKKGHK